MRKRQRVTEGKIDSMTIYMRERERWRERQSEKDNERVTKNQKWSERDIVMEEVIVTVTESDKVRIMEEGRERESDGGRETE